MKTIISQGRRTARRRRDFPLAQSRDTFIRDVEMEVSVERVWHAKWSQRDCNPSGRSASLDSVEYLAPGGSAWQLSSARSVDAYERYERVTHPASVPSPRQVIGEAVRADKYVDLLPGVNVGPPRRWPR